MERAIKDLCQLSDASFFEEVATGIGHVVEVVGRLDPAAHNLSEAGDHHPARILGNLAEEEAAKVLILVDAVRCPRDKQKEKSRTLGYFYEHLAKGIYAKVCKWSPADFAEVVRGVKRERVEYYLDGPSDVDWIFPNRITEQREDERYVGYVRDDSEEEGQGERYWVCPRNDDRCKVLYAVSAAKSMGMLGFLPPVDPRGGYRGPTLADGGKAGPGGPIIRAG